MCLPLGLSWNACMFALPKQLINSSPEIEPDFPCLADEIAIPRLDMNIKVAAFTVSKKSIYTGIIFGLLHSSYNSSHTWLWCQTRHRVTGFIYNICPQLIYYRYLPVSSLVFSTAATIAPILGCDVIPDIESQASSTISAHSWFTIDTYQYHLWSSPQQLQ